MERKKMQNIYSKVSKMILKVIDKKGQKMFKIWKNVQNIKKIIQKFESLGKPKVWQNPNNENAKWNWNYSKWSSK